MDFFLGGDGSVPVLDALEKLELENPPLHDQLTAVLEDWEQEWLDPVLLTSLEDGIYGVLVAEPLADGAFDRRGRHDDYWLLWTVCPRTFKVIFLAFEKNSGHFGKMRAISIARRRRMEYLISWAAWTS